MSSSGTTTARRTSSLRARSYSHVLRLFKMQRGEVQRALLTFSYLFFIICSYLMIKAIRGAMFIAEFGAMKLPYVMLGIALLAGVFAAGYIRVARRVPGPELIFRTLLLFALNVLIFWWLALQEHAWLYPVIYIWAGIFGVIAPMQVWTLANELFTTREAKRLFGVVGAGGILGAVVGGWLAGRLASVIGTTHLLLVVVGLLLAAAMTVKVLTRLRTVRRVRVQQLPPPRDLTQSLKLIGASSHLRLLAGLVFISALATTSVDFQFSVMADRAIDGRDQLTAFFGAVFGAISLISFLFQLLLTSRILAYAGVGISILALPVALVSSSLALLASKTLFSAVMLKGSDGALKHSLDRSCRELMYLPVPSNVKLHAKSTIDTVMDRAGDGSAGALQLLITAGLGLGLTGSLVANLFVIAVWGVLAFRLRKQYVEQLRGAIQRPRAAMVENRLIGDHDTRATLEHVLRSGNQQERLAVLEWIGRERIPVDEKLVLELARNPPSRELGRAALGVLLGDPEMAFPQELMDGLEEEGHSVLISAIDSLVETDPESRRQRLEELLQTTGNTTRLSLVAYILRRLGPEFEPFAERVFDALLAPDAPRRARRAAARALALLPRDSRLLSRLRSLVDDGDDGVAFAAVEAAGRVRDPGLVLSLIECLARPPLRAAARRALVEAGDMAVIPLADTLADPAVDLLVRRQVPRVLSELGGRRALAPLVAGLEQEDHQLRDRCVTALHRMRRHDARMDPLENRAIMRAVREQARLHERVRLIVETLTQEGLPDSDALSFLLQALEEERHQILERIFKLLGLGYPLHDIGRARFAVRRGSAVERSNAVELLDNTLSKRLKGLVVPLLESYLGDPRVADPTIKHLTLQDAMDQLVHWPNPWIGAVTWHLLRTVPVAGFEAAAREAAGSTEEVLREEAAAFVAEAGAGGPA